MVKKNAILDTDFFLHHVPIDQIDWLAQLSCQQAVLLLIPTVIGQLNDKKDASGSHKLRSRAALAIKRLEELFAQQQPLMIRENVELRFVGTEPQLDFPTNGLSKDVKDDWLIAAAIELKSQISKYESLFIVTGDLGLKMKAAPRNIEAITLPEQFRLPDGEDPAERRVKDLENQVRQLSSRLPVLLLQFGNDAEHLEIEFRRPEPMEQVTARKMAELRDKYPKLTMEPPLQIVTVLGAFDAFDKIEPSRITDYNAKLDMFFGDYEKFLSKRQPVIDRLHRRAKVELKLINEGTSPATDIDIDVHIPDGVLVLDDEDKLSMPKEPQPPSRPSTLRETMEAFGRVPISDYLAHHLADSFTMPQIPTRFVRRNVSGTRIRKTNSYDLSVHVGTLKHDDEVPLDGFCIEFESWEAIKPFSMEYRLHAANLPRPLNGMLNLRFKIV